MTKDELHQIRESSKADTADDDGHGLPNQAKYDPERMEQCIADRAALLAYIDSLTEGGVPMTKQQARDAIRFASQNCEEIGIGNNPLSDAELDELEVEARKLLAAVAAYRQQARLRVAEKP